MPKTAEAPAGEELRPPPPSTSARLISLDAFRGLTIALMIMANNAGSSAMYYQFQHAEWNGWTIADTIFPSFIWIVGVAITISLGKRLAAGTPKPRLITQAARRAAILFVFGLIIYAVPNFDLSTQRILGVLQRIAICYFIAVLIYLSTNVRGQIIWTLGLLASYWMLMTLVPVPGYGPGNLSVDGNFAHYIDRIVLGHHNYHSTKTWDPEGVISTIPSIATALLGLLAGRLLIIRRSLAERCVWMFITGSALMFAAFVCEIWMPINKHLWTSSFSLFMAGLDFLIFGGFLWLIDGCGYKKFAKPFTIFGMNAITVYMVSELFSELLHAIPVGDGNLRQWIFQNLFASMASPQTAAFLYALAFTLLMYVLAYGLYRKKWFLRV
ncbi:MAG TPA: heparan-alpha-glucosaminide N-acetyltransferase domain-containing protein [Bryobacteraceae bacterium]|jgi:predicted acyltransferase|nr:heparan-alpha-glucosaminide N-acetyltransferase domain-containing protein [Bryobacteraceae bacterium]